MVRWLTLILIGWLAYALVRALWTFIRLDAPLYDWQWYLAIIILLIGLSTRIVWRLPRSRLAICAFAGLLIWVIVGYGGLSGVIVYRSARHSPSAQRGSCTHQRIAARATRLTAAPRAKSQL